MLIFGLLMAAIGAVFFYYAESPLGAAPVLAFWLMAAFYLSHPLAGFLSGLPRFIHPPSSDRARPRSSFAEARRVKGYYHEAIAAYEEIVAEFPTERDAWIALVEISLEALRDGARADQFLRRGLAALPHEADRSLLIQYYHSSRRKAGMALPG